MKTRLVERNIVIPEATKWAFTTRRVNRNDIKGIEPDVSLAAPGDLLLGRIITIGQHKKVQLANGRQSESYIGDPVVMAVGNRYAPDQFEGLSEISHDNCDVIAGGGVVGRVIKANGKMSEPTKIQPQGLLTDAKGNVVNVASYAIPEATIPADVTVIGVFGASMNAGKTTAAVSLAHGLMQAGHKVAGVKVTGTGAFGDFNAFLDASIPAMDFTDAGMATTYMMPLERIEQAFESLVGYAASRGARIVVVEIADGVFQQETAAILRDSHIIRRLDAVMFAACDALAAVGGVKYLREHGIEPFAVSGLLTNSPLATQEAFFATGVPMISRDELRNPATVSRSMSGFISDRKNAWPSSTTTEAEAA